MTAMNQPSGAWIFVSHSHHDLKKVREIRNYLETRGHNPLLFFLKCLNDDDARLPELIREEIKARNFFVLCDSPNAKVSKYVPDEVALVESLDGKVKETIDIGQELEPQLYKLDRLLKRATVFLNYAPEDKGIADRIRDALIRHDYCVRFDDEFTKGRGSESSVESAMDDALSRGFVLAIVSPAWLTNKSCEYLTRAAEHLHVQSPRKGSLLSVGMAPIDFQAFPRILLRYMYFDLSTGPFDERVEEVIRCLKSIEME
jgi:hypothetical protein